MLGVKINTDSAMMAAQNIRTINGQIRDGFPDVQTAMNQLENAWDGAAASVAIGKFNELRSIFPDVRYDVIENYALFLLQQVGEGYEQTETANISLADAFK